MGTLHAPASNTQIGVSRRRIRTVMTTVSMPILHRPAELAELLDCSLRHVYDLRLPSYHPTRRVTLIRADDAMRLTGVPLDTYETIDGWPDVAAAARILRVSTRHVHRLMSDGTLPYRKPTLRRALISPDGLLRLVGGPA